MADTQLSIRLSTGKFGENIFPLKLSQTIAIYDCNTSSVITDLLSRYSLNFWTFLGGSTKQVTLKGYLERRHGVNFRSHLNIMCQLSNAYCFMHRQEPPIILGSVNPEAIFMKWSVEKQPICRIEIPDYFELIELDERRRKCISSAFRKGTKWDESCYFLAPDVCWDLTCTSCTVAGDVFSLGLVFVSMFLDEIRDYELISFAGRYQLNLNQIILGYVLINEIDVWV